MTPDNWTVYGMVRRLLLSIAFGLALGFGLTHLPAKYGKYAMLAVFLLIAGGMAQAFLLILNLHWIFRQGRRLEDGLSCETKPWYVEWNSFLDRHSGKL